MLLGIPFFHQTGNHRVLVVIVPKWNKVLYLDSLRSQLHDFNLLKRVIDEAYEKAKIKKENNCKLSHAIKFPCHQQPPGNSYGFYAIHHLRIIMKKNKFRKI
ncbi:hypothetical protein BS78_03G151500 [Paspalum vaginatum]|nr:hypothetical protein BS78_03G151500 [Paspalum vaginatum]